MSEATAPALSRRRLFEIIGASVGGAAAYQAMTRLGYAEESPYRGPIKLDGDPKGASVVILGAGLAGMTAAIELERARLRRERARVQPPSGRTELDDSRRRRLHRTRRSNASMRVRPRPLSQSGAVADSLSSLRNPGLLPPLRGRARALHPAQPQRLFAFRQCVRRQAAAHPRHQGRFRRRRRRAPRQGDEKGRARRHGVDRGSADPARGAAVAGRARQGLPLSGRRGFGGPSGLCRSIREAALARSRSTATRSGCTIF